MKNTLTCLLHIYIVHKEHGTVHSYEWLSSINVKELFFSISAGYVRVNCDSLSNLINILF